MEKTTKKQKTQKLRNYNYNYTTVIWETETLSFYAVSGYCSVLHRQEYDVKYHSTSENQ